MLRYLLPVIALVGLPPLLLILGSRSTRKRWGHRNPIRRTLLVTRWIGWIACLLPILRVLLIRVEDHFGGPGSAVNIALLIATLIVGIAALGMFILNAPERERSLGALASILAVLNGVAIFLAGRLCSVMGRND